MLEDKSRALKLGFSSGMVISLMLFEEAVSTDRLGNAEAREVIFNSD